MKYAILEERPAHYSIRFCPMAGNPSIDFPSLSEDIDPSVVRDNMLVALQDVGIGGALVAEQLEVFDYPNGTVGVHYRYSKNHYDQLWLRLSPLDYVGHLIYRGE